MDAFSTASRKRLTAFAAVVFVFVCSVPSARADVLVRTAAPERPVATHSQMAAIEQAATGNGVTDYATYELPTPPGQGEKSAAPLDADKAALLAALLLIPPPVDLIVEVPTATPDGNTPVVTWGPDLTIPQIPGGPGGQVLHTQVAPEPTSFLLGAVGGGFACLGAWFRRRNAIRRAKANRDAAKIVGECEGLAALAAH
jgi:hypothetical protein